MVELGISPEYVLDRMEIYEIRALMEHRYLRHKESWEQARMIGFINARCAGAKIKEPKELFSLPWDKDSDKTALESKPATDEECRRLSATACYLLENGLMG